MSTVGSPAPAKGGTGEAGKGIAETTDGGRTWTTRARVNPPGAGFPADVGSMDLSDYLGAISMRESGVGLAWEGRGGTLRTTDGGRTWTDMPPVAQMPDQCHRVARP